MEERIIELGRLVKRKQLTWNNAAKRLNNECGCNLSGDALRKRYALLDSKGITYDAKIENGEEFTTQYHDNTIEAQRIVEYSKEVFGDKDKLLKYLGYDPEQWEFLYVTTSVWQQHTKEQTTKQLYAVKFKIKPRVLDHIPLEQALEVAKSVFKEHIEPINLPKKEKNKELDNSKLLLIPQIEAHLGKISEEIETGTEYNYKIVEERVKKVFEETLKLQEYEKCGKCLLIIGGDFFNSESNSQTTSGTPQQNDIRYKKMFEIGLNLYRDGLLWLRDSFNEIDVQVCCGNHARATEFYLYMALSCYFRNDDIIKFSDNYKDTQSYVFGKVGLFFNHGDANQKRLISSIPAEFYKEYGKTRYRYLFLGHLHKLEIANTENGLTIHRVPAICENDEWHYQNRFGIGNTPQHEIMIFDKDKGLLSNNFIHFKDNKKKLIRRKNDNC